MFEEVEAKEWHCGAILHRLRAEHRAGLDRVGVDFKKDFRDVFRGSFFRRAWLLDGNLIAVGGIHGTMGESMGYAWMAISQEATKHPLTLIRHVKRTLAQIMLFKSELATTVIDGDDAAQRFAIFLGFHVEDEGLGAPAHDRTGRHRLLKHLAMDNVKNRIPVNASSVIAMGYH